MLKKSGSARIPVLSLLILLIAMISIQSGASMAKMLFPIIGPQGMAAWRLAFSSLVLLLIFRPWRYKITLPAWWAIMVYGLVLGCMNLSFYIAIQTIPLGIGVALEFTGPLLVALFTSRKVADLLWVVLSGLGIYLLLPISQVSAGINPKGVFFALIAGGCWALYIIFGKKAGTLSGHYSVAYGSLFAAIIIFPIGVWHVGSTLFTLSILPFAFLIALFSSAIPYTLEMIAMTRLPTRTFGILMSLEPALAALSGYLFLSENLSLAQYIALLAIMIASIGTTFTITEEAEVS